MVSWVRGELEKFWINEIFNVFLYNSYFPCEMLCFFYFQYNCFILMGIVFENEEGRKMIVLVINWNLLFGLVYPRNVMNGK